MAHRLARAERRGLQLAILCRTIAYVVAMAFYAVSLWLSNSAPSALGLGAFAILIAFGVANFIVIGTRHDRPWLKYVTVTLDILAVCALMAFVPLTTAGDLPQIYAFRNFSIAVLMPFVALAGLSFSTMLVLWAGLVATLGWWAAFLIVAAPMPNRLSWSDLPAGATREVWEAVYFSPDFVATGTRMTESLLLLITAAIIALAVARARRVYFAQLRAEAEREAERAARATITQQLGRYVPGAIAQRLIDDPSGLAPQVRNGAALVMDIEDFTAYANERDPAEVIAELNRFLAACADCVSERHGVVISFTGDGLLAAFNTPLEVEAPEREALVVASALVACGARHGFRVRVGIAAGPIAAGSVGSVERQAFTVYGDTVNRAARLEALAKELGEAILVDRAVLGATEGTLHDRGEHLLKGFATPQSVFGLRLVEDADPVAP